MTDWVTVRVPEPDRDEAKDIRPDDATHGDCLVAGAKALAERGDNGPEISVGVTPEVDEDALAELEERVDDAVSGAGGMDYDGAVEACRQAIREELPVEEMRR